MRGLPALGWAPRFTGGNATVVTTAIELLHVIDVVNFLGHETPDAIEASTDSKAAYDLCHRYTSAQNSRHVDRKMFKMRELRGAGRVIVRHVPDENNPADLFTKILTRQPFEKHRKYVLNTAADAGIEAVRAARDGTTMTGKSKLVADDHVKPKSRLVVDGNSASSQRDGTSAP